MDTRPGSKIEWTDMTWNPFVGCAIVSKGCRNCYAMSFANVLAGRAYHQATRQVYSGVTVKNGDKPAVWSGRIARNTDSVWKQPLRVRAPSLIFTMSMSDFFWEEVPIPWLDEALTIIDRCPQHRFQILTKRPERVVPVLQQLGRRRLPDNVWLGATVEDRGRLDRIAILRRAPARVKFLSIEPLLGPLVEPGQRLDLAGIDWIITGGESGPRARPMKAEWVQGVHEEAERQGVAIFFKQWGRASNNPLAAGASREREAAEIVRARDADATAKGGAQIGGQLIRNFPVHMEPGWPRFSGL